MVPRGSTCRSRRGRSSKTRSRSNQGAEYLGDVDEYKSVGFSSSACSADAAAATLTTRGPRFISCSGRLERTETTGCAFSMRFARRCVDVLAFNPRTIRRARSIRTRRSHPFAKNRLPLQFHHRREVVSVPSLPVRRAIELSMVVHAKTSAISIPRGRVTGSSSRAPIEADVLARRSLRGPEALARNDVRQRRVTRRHALRATSPLDPWGGARGVSPLRPRLSRSRSAAELARPHTTSGRRSGSQRLRARSCAVSVMIATRCCQGRAPSAESLRSLCCHARHTRHNLEWPLRGTKSRGVLRCHGRGRGSPP